MKISSTEPDNELYNEWKSKQEGKINSSSSGNNLILQLRTIFLPKIDFSAPYEDSGITFWFDDDYQEDQSRYL